MKALLIYCSGAIAILALLSLASCQCPAKDAPLNADGTKPRCRYVGPNITGSVSFQGVAVSGTLWGDLMTIDQKKPLGPITLPETILGVPINTK